MNKKLLTIVLTGMFFTTALLPSLSNAGNSRMGGQGLHKHTKSTLQPQVRQKLRDRSCLAPGAGSGASQQKGNTYGPGDGTGNKDVGPQDGTGYGDPANK